MVRKSLNRNNLNTESIAGAPGLPEAASGVPGLQQSRGCRFHSEYRQLYNTEYICGYYYTFQTHCFCIFILSCPKICGLGGLAMLNCPLLSGALARFNTWGYGDGT